VSDVAGTDLNLDGASLFLGAGGNVLLTTKVLGEALRVG